MREVKYGAAGVLYAPPALGQQVARFMDGAGVDFLVHWDQHNTTIPRSIWTPDLVPAAATFDGDAMFEPFPIATAAALATERIEIATTCDAIRRAPGVLAQLALTMSHLAGGRYFMCLGAGEEKQFGPYGLERRRPFTHLEEALGAIRLLIDHSDPVDHDSALFPLRNALMALEPFENRPPDLVVIGSHPKIPEMAGRLANGWWCHSSYQASPEEFAEGVSRMRRAADQTGRDPEALRILVSFACIIRPEEEIEAICENAALRWDAAAMVAGPRQWTEIGRVNPLGADFAYARDLIPMNYSREEALKIADAIPPEVVRQLKICGDPASVTKQIQPWIEAGANHVLVYDYGDLVTAASLPEALMGLGRIFEVVNGLRSLNDQPTGPSFEELVGKLAMG